MMSQPSILLINTNTLKPPVSPVGLEYVGEAATEAGVRVEVFDLAFEDDWKLALSQKMKRLALTAVGLSVRNTDDCSFATRKSFIPWIREVISEVRSLTDTPVILGGVGFSVMPGAVLTATGADYGIAGDGEEAVSILLRRLANSEDVSATPNLIYRDWGRIICNRRDYVNLNYLPLPRRRLFNNRKYEELGAIVGIETKRGCAGKCIFCADPVAKGNRSRLRPPDIIAREFHDLVSQGVSWFHLSDSEFNIPLDHARDVCRAMTSAGLGDRVRWYCYCSPVPFDRKLIRLMKDAGCDGINFGVDSLCDGQLSRLGRSYTVSDLCGLTQLLKEERLNYIFDLLIGGPGETEETLKMTIARVREMGIPLAGISAGVRVYPGTPLSQAISDGSVKGKLFPEAGHAPHEPFFYLSPHLGSDAAGLINELVSGDPRFLTLSAPEAKGSYNYAGDDTLSRLIKNGARGAYWDILSRNPAGK